MTSYKKSHKILRSIVTLEVFILNEDLMLTRQQTIILISITNDIRLIQPWFIIVAWFQGFVMGNYINCSW